MQIFNEPSISIDIDKWPSYFKVSCLETLDIFKPRQALNLDPSTKTPTDTPGLSNIPSQQHPTPSSSKPLPKHESPNATTIINHRSIEGNYYGMCTALISDHIQG